MKKISIIFLSFFLFISVTTLFSNKLLELYFTYKLSNWVERKVLIKNFEFVYPNKILISDLQIFNKDTDHFKNIFYTKKIEINFNIRSFMFSDLVIIDKLNIDGPEFFLEIIVKKNQEDKINKEKDFANVEDNIGLAKKINEDLPDKIWPKKIRDINFLINDTNISNGKAFIKVSTLPEVSNVILSDFSFYKIGNDKESKHYKEALKLMFFDIFARIEDNEKKKILKKIYKL